MLSDTITLQKPRFGKENLNLEVGLLQNTNLIAFVKNNKRKIPGLIIVVFLLNTVCWMLRRMN